MKMMDVKIDAKTNSVQFIDGDENVVACLNRNGDLLVKGDIFFFGGGSKSERNGFIDESGNVDVNAFLEYTLGSEENE